MKRTLLLVLVAACAASSPSPRHITHTDPPFALDVPDDFTPLAEETGVAGGRVLELRGPHASSSLEIEWDDPLGSAIAERDMDASAMGTIVGKGELPSGTAWIASEEPGGLTLESYLLSGGKMIRCIAQSDDRRDLQTACKSLAPE